MPAIYCIDTSCLVAAWEERYPIDHFPNFWRLMDAAIQADRIVAPQAVLAETKKKSEELHAWLADRNQMFLEAEAHDRHRRTADPQHEPAEHSRCVQRLWADLHEPFAVDPC